jgi:hypothetical protein
MQTFLPYPDFEQCAKVLDLKRLGKQIIECRQILKAITNPDYGWQNHPAVNMWREDEDALVTYANAMNDEWAERRGRCHGAYLNMCDDIGWCFCGMKCAPSWLSNPLLHSSHRANLLRKDPEWYGKFGWTEEPAEGYWWPTKELA